MSVQQIYEDIVDLAGVRVALYFPAEREEVGRVVRSLFSLVSAPREFPTPGQPSYNKRFSGYWATHYRVRLPETLLNESQKRYTEANVEIQVASVLMHAWSEVEHDLVYKPLQGKLSIDEYAILDELNGLVLAGEIALERLQRAGEQRISEHGASSPTITTLRPLYSNWQGKSCQSKKFMTLHSGGWIFYMPCSANSTWQPQRTWHDI